MGTEMNRDLIAGMGLSTDEIAASTANDPIKMSGFADETSRPRVPELGEHTDAVLADLGLSADEIAALRADGAV